MGKWRVLAFARLHPSLEGMGVCCSIVFCPRMQVGKRQVTNVMKEIIVDLVKIPRDMINWLSFIYLSYCVSFGITIRLRAVSLFSWSVKQNARDWRRETERSLARALPSLNLQKASVVSTRLIYFLQTIRASCIRSTIIWPFLLNFGKNKHNKKI